jgi:hypothetical protein
MGGIDEIEVRTPEGVAAGARPVDLVVHDADDHGPPTALGEVGGDGMGEQPRSFEGPEPLDVVVPAVDPDRHGTGAVDPALEQRRIVDRFPRRTARRDPDEGGHVERLGAEDRWRDLRQEVHAGRAQLHARRGEGHS